MARWITGWVLAVGVASAQERFPERTAAPGPGARGSAVVVKEGGDPLARFAEMHLLRGMTMQAVMAANKCLEQRPDSHDCLEVLGRAAAQAGNCERALPALASVRTSPSWTARAAIAEGLCRVRTGDLEGALAAFAEAAFVNPLGADPYVQAGLVHARQHRVDEVDADIDLLLDHEPEPWQLDLLELWRAHAADDPRLDGLIALLESRIGRAEDRGLHLHLALVTCERWLALGDPTAALADSKVGIELSRGHVRLTACRGEATRIEGDPYLAEALVDRPWHQGKSTPQLDAVRARALVDQGRIDEAGAVVAALPDPFDPVAAQSAWYLARARGDADGMARARRRLAGTVPDPDALLARLTPQQGAP